MHSSASHLGQTQSQEWSIQKRFKSSEMVQKRDACDFCSHLNQVPANMWQKNKGKSGISSISWGRKLFWQPDQPKGLREDFFLTISSKRRMIPNLRNTVTHIPKSYFLTASSVKRHKSIPSFSAPSTSGITDIAPAVTLSGHQPIIARVIRCSKTKQQPSEILRAAVNLFRSSNC